MFGKMSSAEIEKFLKTHFIGHLACCDNTVPYVVPISYAYDSPYLYGYTFPGKKLDIIRNNPGICFQVTDTSDLSNWKSVICQGRFEEITADEEKQHALRVLNQRALPFISSKTMHISSEWPFSDSAQNLVGIFFRIAVQETNGRFEKADSKSYFVS